MYTDLPAHEGPGGGDRLGLEIYALRPREGQLMGSLGELHRSEEEASTGGVFLF